MTSFQSQSAITRNTNIIEQTPLPLQSHSMSPTINTNHLSQSQSHIITKTQINSNRKRSREPCIHDITDNKDTKRRVKFVLFEYGLPNGTTHSSLICESECECQNSDLCLMAPCEQDYSGDICGSIAAIPWGWTDYICVYTPDDQCDPLLGSTARLTCLTDYECIDDQTDDCDPNKGGAHCGGICNPTPDPDGDVCGTIYTCIYDITLCDPNNGGADCGDSSVFCIADVYTCCDGSYVSRDTDNNCEFASCPELCIFTQQHYQYPIENQLFNPTYNIISYISSNVQYFYGTYYATKRLPCGEDIRIDCSNYYYSIDECIDQSPCINIDIQPTIIDNTNSNINGPDLPYRRLLKNNNNNDKMSEICDQDDILHLNLQVLTCIYTQCICT